MKFIRFAKMILALGILTLSVYSVAPHGVQQPSTLVADDAKPGTGGG